MTETMVNSSDNLIRSVLGLKSGQNALLIKTPNGNNIITRYYYKKTPLKNVLKTLKEKVSFLFSFLKSKKTQPKKEMVWIRETENRRKVFKNRNNKEKW